MHLAACGAALQMCFQQYQSADSLKALPAFDHVERRSAKLSGLVCPKNYLGHHVVSLGAQSPRANIVCMKNQTQDHLLVGGAVLVLFALWLSSNPDCDRGCQTMAQHLAEHGLLA